ncbi:MAG TPA: hypothetical protein VEA59_01955 [Patescibacteria group bacterium]|nr:hypothetical protein [Patescibacteria group bacterium]
MAQGITGGIILTNCCGNLQCSGGQNCDCHIDSFGLCTTHGLPEPLLNQPPAPDFETLREELLRVLNRE